jgi:hypothetical protein
MYSLRTIKIFAITWFSAIVLFTAIFIINYLKVKNYQFCCIVQSVTYNDKGSPTVVINGQKYALIWNDWLVHYKIEAGDSLIKEKNTLMLKLVKQKTGEINFFK